MKMRFFTLIILCGIFSCKSRPPECVQNKNDNRQVTVGEIIQKFDSISEFSYKVKQVWKSIKPVTFRELSGQCRFTKIKNDTIIGAHYLLVADRTTMIYNSKDFIYADSVDRSVLIYKLNDYPNPRNRVTAVMPYYLSYNDIMIDLKARMTRMPQSIKSLPDTLIDNKKSVRIKIIEEDTIINNYHSSVYRIIVFEKESLLPVFATKVVHAPGGIYDTQIMEARFSSYKISYNSKNDSYDMASIPFSVKKVRYSTDRQNISKLNINDLAPKWSASLINGDPITSDELKGKIVLLNFTSVFCGYCIKANAVLDKIINNYKNLTVKVISVYPIDKVEDINFFIDKYNIKHPVIIKAEKMQKDYLINGFPNLFIINQNGKIEYISLGYKDNLEKELSESIDRLLK